MYINKNKLIIKGPLGIDKISFEKNITCVIYNRKIVLHSNDKAILNTYATLISNIIMGVTSGYNTKLKIVGLGFRGSVVGNVLYLKMGFSHLVEYKIPNDITITMLKPNLISIYGLNKQKVNKIAADLTKVRKVDVYKGKGIHLFDTKLIKKEPKSK